MAACRGRGSDSANPAECGSTSHARCATPRRRQTPDSAVDDAIARIEHAAWLANEKGSVALEWRATTMLARMLDQRGQVGEARKRLLAVCGPSADGLDSGELDEAKSLLAVLS